MLACHACLPVSASDCLCACGFCGPPDLGVRRVPQGVRFAYRDGSHAVWLKRGHGFPNRAPDWRVSLVTGGKKRFIRSDLNPLPRPAVDVVLTAAGPLRHRGPAAMSWPERWTVDLDANDLNIPKSGSVFSWR